MDIFFGGGRHSTRDAVRGQPWLERRAHGVSALCVDPKGRGGNVGSSPSSLRWGGGNKRNHRCRQRVDLTKGPRWPPASRDRHVPPHVPHWPVSALPCHAPRHDKRRPSASKRPRGKSPSGSGRDNFQKRISVPPARPRQCGGRARRSGLGPAPLGLWCRRGVWIYCCCLHECVCRGSVQSLGSWQDSFALTGRLFPPPPARAGWDCALLRDTFLSISHSTVPSAGAALAEVRGFAGRLQGVLAQSYEGGAPARSPRLISVQLFRGSQASW